MNQSYISSLLTFIKFFLIAFLFVQLTFSIPEVSEHDKNSSPNAKESLDSCPAQFKQKVPVSNEIKKVTATDERLKIIGGKKARPGQFPHQVLLQFQTLKGEFLTCGGSIIHEEFVITAAHCIYDAAHPLDINITAGEIRPMIFPTRGQHRRGVQIFVHEQYNQARNMENDIALIRIDEPFVFTNLVKTIALPLPFYVGQGVATASGWGDTQWGKELGSDDLLYVDDINIISDDVFRIFNTEFVIQDSMICAFASGHDACQGDSGGPLVCLNDKGAPFLCGIISFGHQCATHGYPGVFTEVSHFISWIQRFAPL